MLSQMDRLASCDGRPQILDWRINRQLFYSFEIDTEAVEGALPAMLSPVELRPGVSVMSVGVLRFEPGHFGPRSPQFHEVYVAIHVPPDLSVKMPLPVMNLFATSVFTDSPEFVAQEDHTVYAPARYVPSMEVIFSVDGLAVHVSDERGPMLSLVNTHPGPVFRRAELWGQHYTNTRGLHNGVWEWEGSRFDQMRPARSWRLYRHALFEGIDVGCVRRCYRQMLLEPGAIAHERFFAMRALGDS
jgi:hypothetical protein